MRIVGIETIPIRAADSSDPAKKGSGGITEARKMAHLNSSPAKYFRSTSEGAALDDDILFRELFPGEPLADDGNVTLSSKPGLVRLDMDCVRNWTFQ